MSEVKVNKISPRTACGTVTLGDSGDTFTIPSGATITNAGTATGFGRTGTVDWQTGDIKTAAFIPATGKGYFVNTTGGAVTVNLPAGTAGDIVGLKDYAGTWQTNAVTLNPNGAQLIGGGSALDPTLTSQGGAVLLVYVDGTQGWLTTAESVTESPSGVENFITATGGNQPTAGGCVVDTNYKIHKFTGPGTLCISQVATCAANNLVSYMVVAGGGGTGKNAPGGGGAGGYRELKSPSTPYTASPLDGYPSAPNRITVTATGYPIEVGAGGAGSSSGPLAGSSGLNSTFATITSAGGGGGAGWPVNVAVAGGSGGGARSNQGGSGGAGNTPPTTPAQGFAGGGAQSSPGCSTPYVGGGGGGATTVGATGNPGDGGGGTGATTEISGASVAYSGGGGGGSNDVPSVPGGPGGTGGGGAGGNGISVGNAGAINTGGGGGGPGASYCPNGGMAGGSGIVIIRYKFQ